MTQQQHLETLSEIKSLMERSSRFISLSGLSGVSAGVAALAGAALVYFNSRSRLPEYSSLEESLAAVIPEAGGLGTSTRFLLSVALCVFLLAIGSGIFFTTRKARKQGLPIWDATARRLVVNLAIPIVAGGLFCLLMIYHHAYALVAPATLIFYGLGLINASTYTLHDIRYLGFSEILLGLLSAWFIGYGLLFWSLGFGILHIVYGTYMYYKYER